MRVVSWATVISMISAALGAALRMVVTCCSHESNGARGFKKRHGRGSIDQCRMLIFFFLIFDLFDNSVEL